MNETPADKRCYQLTSFRRHFVDLAQ